MFCLVYESVFEKIDSLGLNGAINNCIWLRYLFFKFDYATLYYQALTFTLFNFLIRLEYKHFLKKRTTFRKQCNALKHNTVE